MKSSVRIGNEPLFGAISVQQSAKLLNVTHSFWFPAMESEEPGVSEVSSEQEDLPPISRRLYEEYDVEIFSNDRGSSGTLSVLERVCIVY